MKCQQAFDLLCFARVVGHLICRQPVFSEPHVEQKGRNEPCEVEDVLLDGNAATESRCAYPHRGLGIGKQEETIGEKEIECKAAWHQNPNRPPKGTLRDAYFLAR